MKKQRRTAASAGNGESTGGIERERAASRTNESGRASERTSDSMIMQIHDVLEEADAFVGELETQAIDTIRALRRQIGFGISTARGALDALGEGSINTARSALRGAGGYVKEHPWQAAAGAVAIGLTTAFLAKGGLETQGRTH